MSLIVEDGTGLSTAQSYASVATADAYHVARGNTAWASLSVAAKEMALMLSTSYLDTQLGRSWVGSRYTQEQALDFPRYLAWDSDGFPVVGVPAGVSSACCEAAYVASCIPGGLEPYDGISSRITSETEGGMSRTYARGLPSIRHWPRVMAPIRKLVNHGVVIGRA